MTVIPYDSSFDPPAPAFKVTLSAPGVSAPAVSMTFLLDSGADATVIPKDLATKLGLPFAGPGKATGVTGVGQPVSIWRVSIETPAGKFIVEAPGMGDEMLIGRDILNQIDLRLDGPKLQLTV